MKAFTSFGLLLVALFFFSCRSWAPYAKESWQIASQRVVDAYARELGNIAPEVVSGIGYKEFEENVTPFSKELFKKNEDFLLLWRGKLEKKLKDGAAHTELATDLRILLSEINLELEEITFEQKYGLVPFIAFSEYVYQNLKDELSDQENLQKRKNALIRFKKYVHGTKDSPALVHGLQEYIEESLMRFKVPLKAAVWPTRYELTNYLNHSGKFISGVKDLLSQFEVKEWSLDFEKFVVQDQRFQSYIRERFLPFSGNRFDKKRVYSFKLKKLGVDSPVDELIRMAKMDYKKTYAEFKKMGVSLASKHRLKKKDHLHFLSFLTARRIESNDKLLKAYEEMNHWLYKMIKEHDLITIKAPPRFIFRFANEAEVKSTPAPFFISPPLLDPSERSLGQFVITPPTKGRIDFSFPEAILSLTAHETIPGHGLQYHVLNERGTSLARVWLAFNSVNIEGWGLYAEDLVFPYVNEETKFILLQRRLWRQVRMFLDPELNLGRISKNRVFEVFEKELGFSRPFAQSEYDRYAYIMPGQGTTYYYGYRKLVGLKNLLREKLGKTFTDKCFNDAVLSLGVLPLDEIHSRLMKTFECPDSRYLDPR